MLYTHISCMYTPSAWPIPGDTIMTIHTIQWVRLGLRLIEHNICTWATTAYCYIFIQAGHTILMNLHVHVHVQGHAPGRPASHWGHTTLSDHYLLAIHEWWIGLGMGTCTWSYMDTYYDRESQRAEEISKALLIWFMTNVECTSQCACEEAIAISMCMYSYKSNFKLHVHIGQLSITNGGLFSCSESFKLICGHRHLALVGSAVLCVYAGVCLTRR